MQKKIALIISSVFDPMALLFALGILAGIQAGFVGRHLMAFLIFLSCFMIVPVIAFRLWYMKHSGVDWDLRDRKKRIKPLIAQVAFGAFDIGFAHFLGFDALMPFFLILFLWIAGFTLVTLRFKISGHSSTIALVAGFVIAWYGWDWWPTLIAVPISGWARVVKKDHTVAQVVAGAVFAFILVGVYEIGQGFFR